MSKKEDCAEASLSLDERGDWETTIKARTRLPIMALYPHRLLFSYFGLKTYAELWERRSEEDVARHLRAFARAVAIEILQIWGGESVVQGCTRIVLLAVMGSSATIGIAMEVEENDQEENDEDEENQSEMTPEEEAALMAKSERQEDWEEPAVDDEVEEDAGAPTETLQQHLTELVYQELSALGSSSLHGVDNVIGALQRTVALPTPFKKLEREGDTEYKVGILAESWESVSCTIELNQTDAVIAVDDIICCFRGLPWALWRLMLI